MIELKGNMTQAEIIRAEKQLKDRRAKALADFKAGRKKSSDTIAIKKAIDDAKKNFIQGLCKKHKQFQKSFRRYDDE